MRIYKSFFQYVIPSMLAFALSGIYAIADGYFVGNALGDSALAAINMAYPVTALLQAVGTGVGMGGAVQYAIHLGDGQTSRARQYFGMALILLCIFSGVCTVLFFIGSPTALRLFGAEGAIFTQGQEYLLYISLGAVFQIFGTGLVPFIRNMGSSLTAMIAMIAGFLTNIALDYTFVWRFSWGMKGAAIATVIGQAMTFLVCLIFFIAKKERPLLRFSSGRGALARQILETALSPFGLTYSPNVTLILVNKSASMVGGSAAVTCYALVSYVSCILMLLMQGVSDGCQPLISLSYGQKKQEHTKAFRNMAYLFALLVALVCMAALFLTGRQVALLFGASPETSREVARVLPLFLWGFIFVSFSRVSTAYFYATEQNRQAYLLIYGEPLALFLLLLVVPSFAGITGTWLCVPLSQLLIGLLSFFFIHKSSVSES